MQIQKQDLLDHYEEMKRLKAAIDADDLKQEEKDSIILAFSKAVDAAFNRMQKIMNDVEMAEKQLTP